MPLPLEQNGLGRSDILRHNSHIATGVPANPIVDSEDVYGGMKPPVDTVATANSLFGDLASVGGGVVVGGETNTLRPYSSIIYVTGESKFYVLTGTAGYNTSDWGWEPLSDHIGGALKVQNPGASDNAENDFTTNAFDADAVRVGSHYQGGLVVEYVNEVTANSDFDTFRLELKNYANLSAIATVATNETWRIPAWNGGDYQFEGSCISVSNDGVQDTVTIAGSLDVTGTLTQGTNVTAASLQVEDQYIKANDGYEAVDQTAAAAQGGFLVQIGVDNATTPTAYYQRGIIWNAANSRWAKADFSSTSTGTDATYTVDAGTAIPILETATAANCHFPQATVGGALDTTQDSWNYYYMTPSAAYTYLTYGASGTVYDIDGTADTDISNQTMTLDGTAAGVTSDQGAQLISGVVPSTSYVSHNKVRTARIFNIRAIATDQNVLDKSLKIQMPDGFFYDDLMMISVYKVTGTLAAHAREEIFGAEVLDGSDGSDNGIITIAFNQLGLSAGDVFDICIVA